MKIILNDQNTWKTELVEFHDVLCLNLHLEDIISGDLYILLEELVSNYFKYAVSAKFKSEIIIEVQKSAEEVSIEIEYEAEPFNPFEFHHENETNLESAKIGGKGLILINNLAQEKQYLRIDNKDKLKIILGG